MTTYDEPPLVQLHEILDEQETDDAAGTRAQWVLVVAGAVVGLVGTLAVLVATAPAWLQVIRVVSVLGVPHDPLP